MNNNSKSVLYATVAVLSWSTVATAFKIALRNMTAYEMLLVACITSLFIFTVLITVQKKWELIKSVLVHQIVIFALLGLLNPVAYYLILFKAYELLPAHVAQPINYIWPILLLILLAIFVGQPIPWKKYIGMLISLAGVTIISLRGDSSTNEALPMWGLVFAFSSALLWAIYWMVTNKYKSTIDGSVSLFMSFLFGSIYMLVGTLFVDVSLDSLSGIASGVYIGTFEMGIPFIFFGMALRNTTNPALIDQFCYLAPFLSLSFISVVLGEHITFSTYIDLTLIVGGILFNQYLVKN